jgi:endonuclease/exonuclease/phosphatase family metal-dependent hydrolase
MILKLLSYNIRYGGEGREKQLAAVIQQSAADVVVFQEATKPHVIERLAKETGMSTWAARPAWSLGFMSRIEIAYYEWHQAPGTRRPFLEILPAETKARIFGLHLSAIHSNWTERRRVRETQALLAGIKQHQEGIHVLVGDFNTLAPGELLDVRLLPRRLRPLVWLSGGNIRWEAVQVLLDARYVDGYRLLHPSEPGVTFPTWAPHLRLDYVFLPAQFSERLKACQVLNEGAATAQASDHFPLLVHLEV